MKKTVILLAFTLGVILLMGILRSNKEVDLGAKARKQLEREYGTLGKTIDDLLRLEGSQPIHKILFAIKYKTELKLALRGIDGLSAPELRFYAMEDFERGVNMDGFSLYFYNDTGDYAEEALAGLKEAGAKKAADIMSRAMSVFPAGRVPRDKTERQRIHDTIASVASPVWEQCGKEFFAGANSIEDALLSYVKAHKTEFVFLQ
ncbi:MAG: DUF4375 domain-containing protein [Verrucomicrobia bacterium]|nr:DUF4375 domain-containing protein [Verrucomicrobiota bacterium]